MTPPVKAGFRHEAFFYADDAAFLRGTTDFVRRAVGRGEPVLAVLDARKIEALRGLVGGELVEFADMAAVGANPARIIPAWQAFVDRHAGRGRHPHGIGEPIWAGRSPDELVECRQHEALLNLAFAYADAFTLLCPYDTATLDPAVLAGAHGTHPHVSGAPSDGDGYDGVDAAALLREPLPDPPADVVTLAFGPELTPARHFAMRTARALGFAARADDLALIVGELATNSVRYGGGGGVLALWRDGDALRCEVRDTGTIADPLVGRRRPANGQIGGRGLWVVNQLSQLVQIRSTAKGSRVRVLLG